MAPTNLNVQLHTIELPKSAKRQAVYAIAKIGSSARRFPVCNTPSITGAYFWKAAVLFNWVDNADLEWVVYAFNGTTESCIGNCFVALQPLCSLANGAYDSKRLKVEGKSGAVLCFSAELVPRPTMPDGSIAASVLLQPQFMSQSSESDAPLFCGLDNANGPSIWIGFDTSKEIADEPSTTDEKSPAPRDLPRPRALVGPVSTIDHVITSDKPPAEDLQHQPTKVRLRDRMMNKMSHFVKRPTK